MAILEKLSHSRELSHPWNYLLSNHLQRLDLVDIPYIEDILAEAHLR
jgi:hypothetical protein